MLQLQDFQEYLSSGVQSVANSINEVSSRAHSTLHCLHK
jgi:hypothetical protein